jgi:hypothetical protein
MSKGIIELSQAQNCKVFYFPSPYGRVPIIECKGRKVVAWMKATLKVFWLWCCNVVTKML